MNLIQTCCRQTHQNIGKNIGGNSYIGGPMYLSVSDLCFIIFVCFSCFIQQLFNLRVRFKNKLNKRTHKTCCLVARIDMFC